MKHILLAAALLVSGAGSYAQCDKKSVISSSKTEYLAPDSSVQRAMDEESTVEFDAKTFTILRPGRESQSASVLSNTCNWTKPYQNGRSEIKVSFTNPNGENRDATVLIDGKDEKISCIIRIDGPEQRIIRLTITKFEEKK